MLTKMMQIKACTPGLNRRETQQSQPYTGVSPVNFRDVSSSASH
ncbi:hypothetical protein [Erwinia typographi]|nr:hypothetical protein [Erwinia typographi]